MRIPGIDVSLTQIGVLAVLWTAFLLSFVDRLSWPPVMPTAAQELGMSAKQAGSYMTAFYIGYVVTQLPGGILTDRFGYRRVLLGSFLVMGCFTALMGTVTTYEQGFIYRVMAGIGSGAIFSASVRAIFDWFPGKGRGTAMGIFMTASSFGVSAVNLFVPQLAKQYDWNIAFIAAGILPVAAFILALPFLHERSPISAVQSKHTLKEFYQDIKVLLRNKDLLMAGVAGFCAMWATWGTATWANTYLNKGLKLSLVDAGAIMSLYGFTAIFCKPIAGFLADWLGRKKLLLMLIFLVFGPLLVVFGATSNVAFIYVLAPLLGIAAFIYSPIMNNLIGELVDPAQVGAATGLVNTIWQLGSLLSPLVVGMILDGTGNYFYAFLTLAAGPLAAVPAMMMVSEKESVLDNKKAIKWYIDKKTC